MIERLAKAILFYRHAALATSKSPKDILSVMPLEECCFCRLRRSLYQKMFKKKQKVIITFTARHVVVVVCEPANR